MNSKAQRLIQYLKTIELTEMVCGEVSCGGDSCTGCPLEDGGSLQATLDHIRIKEDTSNEQP